MKKLCIVMGAVSICYSLAASSAEVLKITPGMWETTVTSTNSFTGTTTRTMSQCLEEDFFDPKNMMEGAEGCEMTESDVDGNTLSFTMVCDVEGGTGTLQGVYTVDGDHGEGVMNMEMSFGGQTMTMKNESVGTRIGDC